MSVTNSYWVAAILLLPLVIMQTELAADDIPQGRRLAIVVGVNNYRANQGLENLKQAVNDARDLSQALRDAGFKVVEMTHEAAKEPGKESLAPNADFIRDQISGIVDTPNLGRDDTILITLHGHGVQFDFTEVIKKDGKDVTIVAPKMYFCPADASLLDSKGEKVQNANDLKERNHLLALDELYEQLGLCKSATKLLIVDACRNDPSSPLFRSSDDAKLKTVTMPKLPPPPGGIAAFFSCKANQRAVDDPELKHGVFTHYLIQGIQGKADLPLESKSTDGVVTLSELTTYVANNTYAFVFDKYKGLKQSPDIKGEFDTNTPIVRLEALIAPKSMRIPFNSSEAKAAQVAWAKYYRTTVTTSLPSGGEMILIPPGEFDMGAAPADVALMNSFRYHAGTTEDRHHVRLTKPFRIGAAEVTRKQFADIMEIPDQKLEELELKEGRRLPITVSWFDAIGFCNKLSRISGKPEYYRLSNIERSNGSIQNANIEIVGGSGYRLPTEAEWEYACRAGTSTAFSYGDKFDGRFANSWDDPDRLGGSLFTNPVPVKSYLPNSFGLYDMHGNQWEWCEDWYSVEYYRRSPHDNPTGPTNGEERVARGGCFMNSYIQSASFFRFQGKPQDNVPSFRIANFE